MSDWYRNFAMGLLTVLIVSATGQWLVWIKWSARIDEQHIQYDKAFAQLSNRDIPARNAEARISVLEVQLSAILSNLVIIRDNQTILLYGKRSQIQNGQ